jgi:hypothetical protein
MNPCSPQGGRRLAAPSLIVTAAVTLTAAFAPTAGAATASAAAAGAYRHADTAVISAAKKVVGCERAHGARSKACTVRRVRLQAAGVKLSHLQRRIARRSAATSLSARQKAPALSVAGTALTWTKVADVSSYVVVAKAAGQTDRYSVVTGTSTTPAPQAGKTVAYAVRTAIVGSAWSREAKVAYPATDSRLAAPKLVVDGQTVRWAPIAGVDSYVYVVKVPGVTDVYKTTTATSITPAPVPGQTVRVGVRTNVTDSTWAAEASITYAAGSTTAPATGTTAPPPTSTESTGSTGATGTTGSTGATAPTSSVAFQVGLVSNSAYAMELPHITSLGARTARLEFDINTPAADLATYMDTYARAGVRPLLLAGFAGRTPTSAEARNLATWAAAYGPNGTFWQGKSYPAGTAVTSIEFGNESNQAYQYSTLASNSGWATTSTYATIAQQYATGFKVAAQAIAAANPKVGLLAIADTPGNWTSWMDNIYKAVPDFSSYVAGWTMHPYGPSSRWQPNMDTTLSILAAHGVPATSPIYITEYGISTDNGRCLDDNYGWDKCMTYDAAGTALTSTVSAMRARYGSRLAGLYVYQANDQRASATTTNRESYFGSLTQSGAAKGGYTAAVKALLAG